MDALLYNTGCVENVEEACSQESLALDTLFSQTDFNEEKKRGKKE